MNSKKTIIIRALKRVGVASIGEVIGRSANLALPFIVLSHYAADRQTDTFFFALAIGFFSFGTITNASVNALITDFVRDEKPRNPLIYLQVCLAISAVTGVVAFAASNQPWPAPTSIIVGVSICIMALSGLAAAPAIAALNAGHRYVAPGITWGLRIFPLLIFWIYSPRGTSGLIELLVGLSIADALRSIVLMRMARSRLSVTTSHHIRFPRATLYLVSSGMIVGLNPLISRWIADKGPHGSLSLFDMADRLYSTTASLATIGMGSVVMVYLARLQSSENAAAQWRMTLKASIAWSILWFLVGLSIWMIFPQLHILLREQAAFALSDIRQTYLGLVFGIPAFVMTITFARRLLAIGASEKLLLVSLINVLCNTTIGITLYQIIGTKGLGYAFTIAQYASAITMYLFILNAEK